MSVADHGVADGAPVGGPERRLRPARLRRRGRGRGVAPVGAGATCRATTNTRIPARMTANSSTARMTRVIRTLRQENIAYGLVVRVLGDEPAKRPEQHRELRLPHAWRGIRQRRALQSAGLRVLATALTATRRDRLVVTRKAPHDRPAVVPLRSSKQTREGGP